MSRRRRRANPEIVELLTGAPWWSVPVAAMVTAIVAVLAGRSGTWWGAVLAGGWYLWTATVGLLFAAGWWRGRQRRQLFDQVRSIEAVRTMPWRQFEMLVGEYFRRRSYNVVERGGAGSDGGVDLELRRGAERLVVQCKRWRERQVTVQTVRELWGVVGHERATGAVLVTSGTYTADARSFAAGKAYRLIDGAELVSMIAEAQGAATTTERPVTASSAPPPKIALAQPVCPRCGSPTLRKQGVGGRPDFWGCSRYPQCRGLIPITNTAGSKAV